MIRVVVFGCGVMGRKIARALLDKKSFKIAGAVDINPEIVGKDVGTLVDAPGLGVAVQTDAALKTLDADAVVLTTTSHLPDVAAQIGRCVEVGFDVVSTCEQLSYPWKRHPGVAAELDKLAKSRGVTVVGTGINPGFLMDTLPLILSAPCLRVDAVRVRRLQDSARRRIPFQTKIGTNLAPDEWRRKISDGSITGHVGLLESIYAIAAGLGWKLDEANESAPEPILAERETPSGLGSVRAGRAIGLRSTAVGRKGGRSVIELEFVAHAGLKDERDEISIEGDPPIRQVIAGGVPGDAGTVAVTVNTIPRAIEAPPGLKTMMDLAIPRWTP